MTEQEAKELGLKMAIELIGSVSKDVILVSAYSSGFHGGISEFWEVMRNKRIAELDQIKAMELAEFDKLTTI